MKAMLLILAIVLVVASVSCNHSQKAELTVSPDHLPAGGGSVTVTYKTSNFLSSVPFTLTSNPPLSGFPVNWTGNTTGSIKATVTKTTTFTLSNAPSGSTVISKSVSVP